MNIDELAAITREALECMRDKCEDRSVNGDCQHEAQLEEVLRKIDESSCPNCARHHGMIDACLIGVLFSALYNRVEIDYSDRIAEIDPHPIWDVGGPAIDALARQLGVEA